MRYNLLVSLLLVLFIGLLISIFSQTAYATEDAKLDLVSNKEAKAVIVVPPGTMAWEGDTKELNRWNPWSEEPERRKRLVRDSVKDLALYLKKISGGEFEIVEVAPKDDKRIPIYIGKSAEGVFGPVGKDMAGLFGFRVVANQKGIGLYGQSEYGTSYAIYELLHRLGCRWFFPSELGETYPSEKTLRIAQMDLKLAPVTEWRRMESRTADNDFCRRNRMNGGNLVQAQHALENYITKEQREAHPEWKLLVKGEPHPRFLRWTRQDVADAIGDAIIAKLDKAYTPSISLSPIDAVIPTDDPEEMKADPKPRVWEPAAMQWSVTDRLILLANRVAERVGKKYPDIRYGIIAYVNYSMPPERYKINPHVIPMIAPIDFNRAHPMTWTEHPSGSTLLNMLEGWGKTAPALAYYAYGMNLAEITAPNPFITKWGTDIPIILKNNVKYWSPETMGGWESMMPGFYLSMRMTFDSTETPEAILSDLWSRLYGPAAEPMRRYWERMDRAWIDAKEYAGGGLGYLKIFTPEVLQGARADIDEALRVADTTILYQRVKMIDESLSLLELFMKTQQDWAAGKLQKLAENLDEWRSSVRHLRRAYKAQYGFDSGLAIDYIDWYWGAPFAEASKLSREMKLLATPVTTWKYRFDKEKAEVENGWVQPDFDDKEWKTMHVVEDTWSDLGYYDTMGRMAYRANIRLNKLPSGKKKQLWIGSFDGSAQLFVNGKPVKYVVPEKTKQYEEGDVLDEIRGFCKPAMFDVTDTLQAGDNQITILIERNWLNEVGSGGLMGPVTLFSEK